MELHVVSKKGSLTIYLKCDGFRVHLTFVPDFTMILPAIAGFDVLDVYVPIRSVRLYQGNPSVIGVWCSSNKQDIMYAAIPVYLKQIFFQTAIIVV